MLRHIPGSETFHGHLHGSPGVVALGVVGVVAGVGEGSLLWGRVVQGKGMHTDSSHVPGCRRVSVGVLWPLSQPDGPFSLSLCL